MTTAHGKPFRVVYAGKLRVVLHQDQDGLWRDDSETIYGFSNRDASWDKESRFGVWPIALPKSDPLSQGPGTVHDAQYENAVWQEFHSREEADNALKENIERTQTGWRRLTAWPAYAAVRLFGGLFWDVKKTR